LGERHHQDSQAVGPQVDPVTEDERLFVDQEMVEEALKPHSLLSTQPEDVRKGQSKLGQVVRAFADGRMQTVLLTEYDPTSNSYWGVAIRVNPAEDPANEFPKFTPVSGLRAYPYEERLNYAWQFVKPGEDESVLINIAEQNMPSERS